MKRGRTIVAIVALSACGSLPAVSAGSFHAPATGPEMALDKILHLADADDNQLGNLIPARGGGGHVDYTKSLTPALIAAIAKAEKDLVREDCGGKYRKGELCGLDYSPITCAQDSLPAYTYHTILDLGDKVVIEYAWPPNNETTATYTVIKGANGWRIDGVSCAGGAKFH